MFAGKASSRLGRAGVASVLCCAYAASVALSVFLSREGAAGSAIWTANGFLASAIILLDGRWRIGVAAVCLVAQFTICRAAGDGWVLAANNAAIDGLESVAAGFLALRFCAVNARRLSLLTMTRVLMFALIPATVLASTLAASMGSVFFHKDFGDLWVNWATASGLGLIIVTPAVLLLSRFSQYRDFHRSFGETTVLLAGFATLVAVICYEGELPLFFAVFPGLTFIAFRLGPPGAALAGFLVAIIALPMTLLGYGPAMLAKDYGMFGRTLMTEVFVVAALFTGIATASALADQTRLRRLVIWRDQIARSARLRARAAEDRASRFAAE